MSNIYIQSLPYNTVIFFTSNLFLFFHVTSTRGESLIFAQGHNSDIEEHVKDCLASQELPHCKVVIYEN